MRIFTLILIILAIALIAYNITLVDFSDPFKGDSTIAIIGTIAALCAVILLVIFNLSKRIEKTIKDNE